MQNVGEWKIYTCTLTFTSDSGTNNPSVSIHNRKGSVLDASVDVQWAALYEGSYTADTLPPYIPKGYGAELAECQRYFVALRSGAERFAGNVTSDGNSWFTIPLPAPMRAQPTLILHSLGSVASGTEYFTPAAFTGVVGWNGHLIMITLSHSASANGAATLCDFNCDLSADL